VLIVHHSGKNGERGARGSSALKGAVDAEYEVSRSDEDKVIRLTPHKMKDADLPQPLAFELIGVPVHDDTGSLIGGVAPKLVNNPPRPHIPKTAKLGKHQKTALEILEQMEIVIRLARQGRDTGPISIEIDAWKAGCEKAGIPRQRFHDAKNTLTERCQIRVNEPHVSLVRPVLKPLEESDRTDEK